MNLDADTVRYTSSGEKGIWKKGVANVISHSLSILWAMKGGHCWLVVFMQEVAILWFTPQYCDVVQYGASSNNKADLLRLHSYFWVKQMKPSLPPSKGLFNGHPCSFMGLVECFLIYRCRVEIWGHEIWFTRVPNISKKQAIFQCAGLRLKPLSNQWTAKYEAVMCAIRQSWNDVRKHAYKNFNNNFCTLLRNSIKYPYLPYWEFLLIVRESILLEIPWLNLIDFW